MEALNWVKFHQSNSVRSDLFAFLIINHTLSTGHSVLRARYNPNHIVSNPEAVKYRYMTYPLVHISLSMTFGKFSQVSGRLLLMPSSRLQGNPLVLLSECPFKS